MGAPQAVRAAGAKQGRRVKVVAKKAQAGKGRQAAREAPVAKEALTAKEALVARAARSKEVDHKMVEAPAVEDPVAAMAAEAMEAVALGATEALAAMVATEETRMAVAP